MMSEVSGYTPPNADSAITKENTELSKTEILAKLRDPDFLPTRDQVFLAFSDPQKLSPYHYDEKAWRDYVFDKTHPVFEFLNKEYVDALGAYLVERVKALSETGQKPVKILEVGAGNGRLSHFLEEYLEAHIPGQTLVIPTDSIDWDLAPAYAIEEIDVKDALKKHQPQIVISSWMPRDADFTPDFRATPSVAEYLVIGETKLCGGFEDVQEKSGKFGFLQRIFPKDKNLKTTAQNEGFEAGYLKELKKFQICRTDEPLPEESYRSRTQYFRKKI